MIVRTVWLSPHDGRKTDWVADTNAANCRASRVHACRYCVPCIAASMPKRPAAVSGVGATQGHAIRKPTK
eukprot:6467629-Amphidinium_carterae.1